MEPISRKASATEIAKAGQVQSDGQKSGPAKSGPSKFDLLRGELNQKLAHAPQLAPQVTSISEQQKKILENDLRRKLETGKSPQEMFGGDMKHLRSKIADLNRQVSAVPDVGAFAPLRERLKRIESDFNASAKLLNDPVSLDDPNRLLQMQMEVYKLAQNVEILSRTVSEAASGVKTILQTQV
jgi:type III secretion system YscI/HrpB-like protein